MDQQTGNGMTNARKAGIAVVILLILAGPFYPWLIGLVVESKINKGQDDVVKRFPYIAIVDRSYQRGWFSSEQTVTFEMFAGWARTLGAASKISDPPVATAPAGAPDARITVHSIIRHGPWLGGDGVGLASVDTHIMASEATRAELAKVFGNQEPLGIHSRLSLFGGGSTLITSPAFKDAAIGETGKKLSSDGLSLKFAGDRHVTASGGAPRLVVTNGDGTTAFSMTGLAIDADLRQLVGFIYAGTMDFRIDEVSGGADADHFSMKALNYGATITRQGDLHDMSVKFDAGAIELPQWKASDAHFDVTLARLHTATMAQLQEANQQNFSAAKGDPQAAVTRMMEQYRKYGLQLLQYDPELHFDQVGFTAPDGTLSLKGVIKTHGVVAADLQTGSSPMALLQKISAALDFTVTEQLLDRLAAARGAAPTQLDPVIAQGLLRRENGNLVSHIEFRDGKFTANGKAIGPTAATARP